MCIEVTSTPTATSSQQTTPTATSPLLCYSCSRANREECDESQTVQTCDVGDVCRLVVFRVAQAFGGGVVSFQRGCFPNASCTESDECRGTLGGNCIRCCDSNLCNDGDIDTIPTTDVAPSTLSPTTPPPVTTSTTPALLRCYSCSQKNKETCDSYPAAQTCSPGNVCRTVVHKLPQVFGGLVTSFQRHCFPQSMCNKLDDCNRNVGGDCIRCCNSDLCNDGDIEPTTAPRLQCYSCSQRSKERCDSYQTEQTCNVGDVCRTVVHKLQERVTFFQRSCFTSSKCKRVDGCSNIAGGICVRCCDNNLCNDGDIAMPGCRYNGDYYKSGDIFKTSDRCNYCICRDGRIACTEKYCKPTEATTGCHVEQKQKFLYYDVGFFTFCRTVQKHNIITCSGYCSVGGARVACQPLYEHKLVDLKCPTRRSALKKVVQVVASCSCSNN
ncbi:uncharacterized skeletal organic matrix protein 2-like isoform X2 [Corticium candelabrum]|uniref:uncharacterized skeletal organic matrix protein 2-like isoform X2 n=1 Tax=Corticium candelabrum TaxID=121492 RepID=UPI002E265717|nr:uncharacterized skeletal organic matrix protein 2-like isoform X2 [Corticium candelabrum]